MDPVEKYFARECKILQEARHPNIVQYIGLCLAPPGPPMDPHLYANSDDEEEHDSRSIVDHHGQKPAPRVLIVSEYVSQITFLHQSLNLYNLAFYLMYIPVTKRKSTQSHSRS